MHTARAGVLSLCTSAQAQTQKGGRVRANYATRKRTQPACAPATPRLARGRPQSGVLHRHGRTCGGRPVFLRGSTPRATLLRPCSSYREHTQARFVVWRNSPTNSFVGAFSLSPSTRGAPAARMKMHIPWLQAVTLLVRAGPGTCRPRFSCACWPRARGRRDARRARAAVVHSSAGCMQACPLRAASALQRPPPPRTRWRAWDAPRSPACGAQHCRLVLPTHSRTPQRAAGLPVCVRACMGACVTV